MSRSKPMRASPSWELEAGGSEAFELLREMTSAHDAPMSLAPCGDTAGFGLRHRGARWGPALVDELATGPLTIRRSASDIGRNRGEAICVGLHHRGDLTVSTRSEARTLAPGDLWLNHVAVPYEATQMSPCRATVVTVPVELAPRHLRALLERRVATLDASTVAARAAVALIRCMTDDRSESASDGQEDMRGAIATALCDVLAGAFVASPVDPHARLYERANAWLHAHACDSDASPGEAARALRISVRYLHLVFARRGTTFMRALNQLRLEGARTALTDPRKAHLNVTEIALSMGFTDGSHFARRFKGAFGVTPRALRVQAKRG